MKNSSKSSDNHNTDDKNKKNNKKTESQIDIKYLSSAVKGKVKYNIHYYIVLIFKNTKLLLYGFY